MSLFVTLWSFVTNALLTRNLSLSRLAVKIDVAWARAWGIYALRRAYVKVCGDKKSSRRMRQGGQGGRNTVSLTNH